MFHAAISVAKIYKEHKMKKSQLFINLISFRLKFPVSLSSKNIYDNKLVNLGFNTAFEDDMHIMTCLKDRWTEHSWLFKALACILGLACFMQEIFF